MAPLGQDFAAGGKDDDLMTPPLLVRMPYPWISLGSLHPQVA